MNTCVGNELEKKKEQSQIANVAVTSAFFYRVTITDNITGGNLGKK